MFKKMMIKLVLFFSLFANFGVIASVSQPTGVVYAETVEGALKPFILLDTTAGVQEVVTAVNKVSAVTELRFNVFTYSTVSNKAKVEMDKPRYLKLSATEQKKLMEAILVSINNSGIGSRDKNRFLNFVESQDSALVKQLRFLNSDTSVDLENSKVILGFFQTGWGLFMGILLLLTLLLLVTSVALDMIYITSPYFYSLVHAKSDARVWFISFEAYSVMREEVGLMQSSRSSNYMLKYFKRRALIFFFVGVLFTLVVSNSIWRFMDGIYEFVDNLLKAMKWS